MQSLFFRISLLILLISTDSCINRSEPDLVFSFIGDVHYRIPDYLTAEYLVPAVANEFDNLKYKPDLIMLTGDFFHGSRETDIESESNFAFQNFSENFRIPFFIAKGNHDSREYFEKNALPLFSSELKTIINRSYFSFNRSNCHFIMLDCNDEKLKDQLLWLKEDLETAKSDPEIEHIFVSGHFPLWIVARAGFTRPDYAAPVAALLAKYKVDAYFCGHTHNKALTVRIIDGQPLTQIMDAAVVEENRLFNLAPFLRNVRTEPEDIFRPGLLPLEESHQIFIPPSELKYYWGYQEGSTTSYYIITVKGKSVQADWHVVAQGVVRSVKWMQPGIITDLKTPAEKNGNPLTESDFGPVEKAWLYAAPWTDEDSVAAYFKINGVPSGKLEISRVKMANSPFWNNIEVPLDSSAVGAIKMANELEITNPSNGRFGLAHMFLLVKFKNGYFAKSTLSPRVLTSFITEEGQYPNFPDKELIERVNSGEPLAKVTLKFERFYEQ